MCCIRKYNEKVKLIICEIEQQFLSLHYCVDGNHNQGSLNTAVAQLRKSSIEVFAVGVGGSIKSSELNIIASKPSSSHVFRVQDYSQLQGKLGTLGQAVCPSK